LNGVKAAVATTKCRAAIPAAMLLNSRTASLRISLSQCNDKRPGAGMGTGSGTSFDSDRTMIVRRT
jgi:hypothetical protein